MWPSGKCLKLANTIGKKQFSTISSTFAPKKATLTKEQIKKEQAKALSKKRLEAKSPPTKKTFYASIPLALRYLRASEVGRSEASSTITVTSTIINDKGTAPVTGAITFPKPLKDIKILVFTTDPIQAELARSLGASLVGGTELVEEIKEGKVDLDFNKALATPEMASQLNPLARNLGPRGLLPNVKKGTMGPDLEKLLKDSVGSMPFKQKGNSISIAVGKVTFKDTEIVKNIMAASKAIKEASTKVKAKRPPVLGSTSISSTFGPSFVIDF